MPRAQQEHTTVRRWGQWLNSRAPHLVVLVLLQLLLQAAQVHRVGGREVQLQDGGLSAKRALCFPTSGWATGGHGAPPPAAGPVPRTPWLHFPRARKRTRTDHTKGNVTIWGRNAQMDRYCSLLIMRTINMWRASQAAATASRFSAAAAEASVSAERTVPGTDARTAGVDAYALSGATRSGDCARASFSWAAGSWR